MVYMQSLQEQITATEKIATSSICLQQKIPAIAGILKETQTTN
jgi:hypothetical protein